MKILGIIMFITFVGVCSFNRKAKHDSSQQLETVKLVVDKVQPEQDTSKIVRVASLNALRAMTVSSNVIYRLTQKGKEGDWSLVNKKDPDNIGTVVVTKNGKRLSRIIKSNEVPVSWFQDLPDEKEVRIKALSKNLANNAYVKTAINFIVSGGNTKRLRVDDDLNVNLEGVPILKKGVTGRGKISYKGAVIYKEGMDVIGMPQNIEQKIYSKTQKNFFGDILPAPLAQRPSAPQIDVLAHFYNDTGLSSNALDPNAYHGWYDSRMFFTNAPEIDRKFQPYDPSRHPLLGWYKGDDKNVLDWQCYWLLKYGVTAVIPTGNITKGNFNSNPKSSMYWVWNMMNNVKNFKNLKYVLYLDMDKSKTSARANAQQDFVIDSVVSKHKNIYCYKVDGKAYPVFFIWDMELARGLYDKYNGAKNVIDRLDRLTEKVKGLGYDGICILGRNLSVNPGSYPEASIQELKDRDCLVYNAGYFKTYDKKSYGNYTVYANISKFPSSRNEVVNIFTSAESRRPHPSKMNIINSTPQAFSTVAERAASWIKSNGNPKMLTVYNVGEWAEGGPGLQPNQRDGFGYLEAIRKITK